MINMPKEIWVSNEKFDCANRYATTEPDPLVRDRYHMHQYICANAYDKLKKENEELRAKKTYKRILGNRISELTDSHDLMHDEFLRIKAITNQASKTAWSEEIKALCDRAISNINRRVPMIKENEGYRQTIESQKQTHDALIKKLTQAQADIKALRETLDDTINALERSIPNERIGLCSEIIREKGNSRHDQAIQKGKVTLKQTEGRNG